MREANVRQRARCRACKIMLRVDLDALCTLRGRSYCLIGAVSPCKVVGCEGQVIFMASPGPGTPFLPLFNASETGTDPVGHGIGEGPPQPPKRAA
jgi:hypothetical protein